MINPQGADLPRLRNLDLGPLRNRNVQLYMLGMLISQTGTHMQVVAEGWLIYQLTNSAFSLGMIGFLAMIPLAPWGLIAGALADRLPRRRLLAMAQVGEMVPPLALAILTWTGQVQYWHIVVADIMMGAMSTVDFASRIALIHSLVKPEEVENGIAVAATLTNLARVIGPAVAGVLIAFAGVAGAFALNGLSFFAVLIALALMRIPRQPVTAHSSSLRADLIEGGLHVLRDRTIMVMLALIMTVSFLVLNYQTILPVFARDILESGPQGLGLLTSAAGAGAVIGALILASRPPQSSQQRLELAVGISIALAPVTAAFAFSKDLVLSAVLLAFLSAGAVALRVNVFTYVHLRTGDRLRGRIASILQLAMSSSLRVGGLFVGAVAARYTAPVSMAFAALICLIVSLTALAFIRLWLRTPQADPENNRMDGHATQDPGVAPSVSISTKE